ncbi:MAG: hypothetical protein IJ659_07420 [Alloprevotella sp.]|nr:hypothetical protein [Alloprevotella sp.]
MKAQVPYSYAPTTGGSEGLSAVGSNKNSFVQGAMLFDPAQDAALARMKGKKILGVRCFLRAAYAQARQSRSAVQAFEGTLSNNVRTKYADLAEGWNDVLFDEPLTIGDEKIYLGLQVYETIGTPYPLVTFPGAVVPQSCWVNIGKKTWEEYTDRGTLLIAALVEDDCAASFEKTAYAQNTTHPQTVAPDADFEGGLYVVNQSASDVSSLEIEMSGTGTTVPTLRTVTLPAPLKPGEATVVQANLHSGLTEGTSVDFQVRVTKVNGEATQEGRPGTTKLYVTYDNFIRIPLIEEFTSQRCINCPQMAYFLDKALEEYEGKYVYVAHHSGFIEDVFTTQPDREITYIFGGYENEYNPAIMYNRAVLEGESNVIQGVRDMSPTPYTEALTLAAAMPAMAQVSIGTEAETVQVSGRIARDLVGTPLYLSCYLVEDGISTKSYYQLGMDDADAPADLADVFRHNGVILHHFTANAAGDLLATDDQGRFEQSFPAVQKAGFGGTRQRLVAFVHKTNKDNLRDNQVLNAVELVVSQTGIASPTEDNAGSSLVTCHSSLTYDLQGRRVNGQWSMFNGQSPKGVYIVNGRKIVR